MTPPDRRRLSRLLSRLANATVAEALAAAATESSTCRRVGVTGAPGAGKSSLLAKLAPHRLRGDNDLAIIAIDPTSPISGGAILGDRIRMQDLATDPHIYIRSLASRSATDGLADNLHDILAAIDGFSFAEVVIETVGVGQVEYAIRGLVDTLVLVLTPGSGDQIQAMKSGILETADIYVINKADMPGARQMMADLNTVLKQRARGPADWPPVIIQTSMNDAASITQLSSEIDRHQAWLAAAGLRADLGGERRRRHVASLIARRVEEILKALPKQALQLPISGLFDAVAARLATPQA
jgi:LAO/AO transport system kinase